MKRKIIKVSTVRITEEFIVEMNDVINDIGEDDEDGDAHLSSGVVNWEVQDWINDNMDDEGTETERFVEDEDWILSSDVIDEVQDAELRVSKEAFYVPDDVVVTSVDNLSSGTTYTIRIKGTDSSFTWSNPTKGQT